LSDRVFFLSGDACFGGLWASIFGCAMSVLEVRY
jgi:hypothetical protein